MIRNFENIEAVARLLKENEIDAILLCEFIEEAIESQALFESLTETIETSGANRVFQKEFLDNLKRFCSLLDQVKTEYPDLIHRAAYATETEKAKVTIENVSKFTKLLMQ